MGVSKDGGAFAQEPALGSPDALANLPDTPSGVFDETNLASIPILPMTDAPADVQAKVKEMADTYEHLLQTNRSGSAVGVVAAPDTVKAPPRMDSGDPNPDRLNLPATTF